jgi:hypothetical protein
MGAVLVGHVELPLIGERLRGKQVMRLIARVVMPGARIEPERRRISRDENDPDDDRPSPRMIYVKPP